MQVLRYISSINKLATILEQNSLDLPNIIEKQARDLENQLTNFVQIPSIIENAASGRLDISRITRTAELYRLGALIHLHRSLLHTPTRSTTMQNIARKSLQILEQNSVCTSPWPLFMVACEVVSDRDRIQILSTIEAMQRMRRIGNVTVIREVIEACGNSQICEKTPKEVSTECESIGKMLSRYGLHSFDIQCSARLGVSTDDNGGFNDCSPFLLICGMVGGLADMIIPCRPHSRQEFAIAASLLRKRSAVVK